MARRSRKRIAEGDRRPGASTRAERDAARRRRAQTPTAPPAARRGRAARDERPPAPWGSFPLTEIVVLLAIVCLVSAFFFHGDRSRTLLAGGAALGSLRGPELTSRRHFSGQNADTPKR